MDILNYQEAFGAWDKTSRKMQKAVEEWTHLYYRSDAENGEDPCQRIPYCIVSKLVRAVFAEHTVTAEKPFVRQVLQALEGKKAEAVQLALVGGACFLKPWPEKGGFGFSLIPRDQVLIFGRDAMGVPTDVGTAEHTTLGNFYFTLLERRRVDENGYLTIENKLYRSGDRGSLGQQVALQTNPLYRALPERYTYETPIGSVGLVQVKTPMLNCVDGSSDGISVYAAATGLIHNIDRNEYQLSGEFERGESRVFTSSDLLSPDKQLTEHLFVGLDDDVERVGLTVFSPQLREQSFLRRKQEYLRNVESVIGLKRGTLCDANMDQRTATEITASAGEHSLTVVDFQRMWQQATVEAVVLCAALGKLYGIPGAGVCDVHTDWGNGVLYDQDKLWEDYKDMVHRGLLTPEVALGWRFGMDADTPEQRKAIRNKYMDNRQSSVPN